MNAEELKTRTKRFGLRVIKLVETFPRSQTGDVIGKQLLRSAVSVGANYRSACFGRSKSDFASKLLIALEEAGESIYWLELFFEANLLPEKIIEDLLNEGKEIVAILTASSKTLQNSHKD